MVIIFICRKEIIMNRNKKLLLSTLAAVILGLTGCQSTSKMNVVVDNNSIEVPKSPKKVVVMNYGALDTLDALGKGSIVTAVPQSVIPSYLQKYNNSGIADTGNMKEPNIDAIKNLKPDLIIIDGRQASKDAQLRQIAPVLNLSVNAKNYYDSTRNHIYALASITGTESKGKAIIESLDVKLQQAQAISHNSHKKAIVAIHNDGKVILINNSSSAALIHDVLNVKRAVPVESNKITQIGEKPKPVFIDNNYIKSVKPDIIYVVDRSKAIGNTAMKENFFDSKVLKNSKTQVVYLTPDLWYLSGGGAESLERQIDEVINGLK